MIPRPARQQKIPFLPLRVPTLANILLRVLRVPGSLITPRPPRPRIFGTPRPPFSGPQKRGRGVRGVTYFYCRGRRPFWGASPWELATLFGATRRGSLRPFLGRPAVGACDPFFLGDLFFLGDPFFKMSPKSRRIANINVALL